MTVSYTIDRPVELEVSAEKLTSGDGWNEPRESEILIRSVELDGDPFELSSDERQLLLDWLYDHWGEQLAALHDADQDRRYHEAVDEGRMR